MYIKFKVDDIEIELGGLDHAFDVKPFVNETVSAVTDIFSTGKVKELRDVIERFVEDDEDDECKKPEEKFVRDKPVITDTRWTKYK